VKLQLALALGPFTSRFNDSFNSRFISVFRQEAMTPLCDTLKLYAIS
jgi:hypothetical protein